MKKTFINLLLGTALFTMAGCEKSKEYKAEFERTNPNNALLKVIYASAYSLNPGVQLSVDDVRVSGLITGRTPFPGGGYNTTGSNFADYLSLTPGNKKFSIAIPKRNTNVDSIVLYTTQITLERDKNYTLNISDTLTKTKSVLVEDSVGVPKLNTTKYRFVNLMPNVPAVDLYYGNELVASNVRYNTAGVVFSRPIPIVTTTNWNVKEYPSTAASANLAFYASGSSVANQKMLTAFAMGYKGSTSATLKPYISFAINY